MPYYSLMNMDYINVKVIADRIKRHPLLEDIPFETILDYTFEFVKIVGMPKAFLEKTEIIEIEDYRGLLPCDLYDITQIRTTDGFYFRGSTDSFHMSPNKEREGNVKRNTGLTYKVQGTCIFTSIPKCTIEIAYKAFALDEEGMPLIIDNGTYARALQEYIKMECFSNLFDEGKISPQVMQHTEKRYTAFVRSAQSDLVKISLDQWESISNMRNKLLDSLRDHSNGYVSMGAKQFLRRH